MYVCMYVCVRVCVSACVLELYHAMLQVKRVVYMCVRVCVRVCVYVCVCVYELLCQVWRIHVCVCGRRGALTSRRRRRAAGRPGGRVRWMLLRVRVHAYLMCMVLCMCGVDTYMCVDTCMC